MTLETFNWLLAIGGGVVVPTSVGFLASYLVRSQDPGIAAQTRAALMPRSTEEAPHEDRVPA